MAEATMSLPRLGPLASRQGVSVALLPPMTRIAARGGTEALTRMCHGFRIDPPTEFLRAREGNSRAALPLGPDEFLLLAPEIDEGLAARIEQGLEGEPGCAVDISHRQVGIDVVGPSAALVLNTGCPLDLDQSAFPIGMCTRTILGKADVVLWRRGADHFRLECWRSFTPYVVAFLTRAAEDAGR